MQNEPEVGDLLRLRSGGPVMTLAYVQGAPDSRYAHCVWFDARDVPHSSNIRVGALMPVPPEAPATDPPPG